MAKPRNDRNVAVTKFCLAMEEHRRTDAGRVRTAKEFVGHFFPHDDSGAKDLLFVHIPNEVRGPVLSAWGIRGAKAALRDDDERVREVVHDALIAGDIDEATFEDGLTPDIFVDWIKLPEWWAFWRRGKLTGVAIQKALAVARELALIDDKWFLANLQGRAGKLKGTDVLCDTLSKDQIVSWVRKVHESGDGSPAGIVQAIGWDTILTKTAQDALLFALDAFAKKAGLVTEAPTTEVASEQPATKPAGDAMAAVAKSPHTTRETPTISAPADASAIAAEEFAARAAAELTATGLAKTQDSAVLAAIPEMSVVDTALAEKSPPLNSDTPVGQAWQTTGGEESPRLAEARAAMMATLMGGSPVAPAREPWEDSEVPAKPSSLDWDAPSGAPGEPKSNTDAAPPANAAPDVLIPIDEEDAQSTPNPRATPKMDAGSAPKIQAAAAAGSAGPPPVPPRRGATRSR